MSGTILKASGIVKCFSGVEVLKNVDFEVKAGEVHGLMGENGAGKSTLIKILTGVYPKDGGTIAVDGRTVEINSRQDARDSGISVIYQELSLIPTLTVMQNIYLGQEPAKWGVLNQKEMRRRVQALIQKCNFDIRPDDLVEKLSIAKRQTVEILKALATDAKVIIMDEPTSCLSARESEILFDVIARLRAQGTSIVYISHRLEEVYRIVDRLTVLRDGKVVGVLGQGEIDSVKVVRMMIGKEVREELKERETAPVEGAAELAVKNLSREGFFSGVSFSAYGGQILGIGGLVGSGRTELLRCLYGVDRYSSGSITLNGKPVPASVRKNIRAGFGFIPEDRRIQGLVPLLSIEDNIALPNYDQLSVGNFLVKRREEKKLASDAIARVDVRPPDPAMQVQNLSGGNQQKVVVGKWLMRKLKVLLVDEPTVGVDVGVKSEIYQLFSQLARQGIIVIVVSSDLKELVTVSDRILVFHGGGIFKEFKRGSVTQEDILLAASGVEVGGQ